MIWKAILLAVFAVGVMADVDIDNYRQQMQGILTEICKVHAAEDKVDEVNGKIMNFTKCVKNLFDIEVIKKEVEEAKPNGALDEVFQKYCEKSPQLKACLRSLTGGLLPCIEQDYIDKANNGTDQLIDFVCHKDGDRIALFIAENGPQCFEEKANDVLQCFMKLGDKIKSPENFRKMSVHDNCKTYDEFSTCMVTALEGCSTPTPANMAEALLQFVRKSTTCPPKKA